MTNWIKLTDKLPSELIFNSVYIVAMYSNLKNKSFVCPLHYIDGEWFEMYQEEPLDTSEYEIKFWMPLPDLPEDLK